MKALSIRQPWAWLIVRPDILGDQRLLAAATGRIKDIENRSWATTFRGRVLIHAAKGIDAWDPDDFEMLRDEFGIELPCPIKDLPRGGIVGAADVTACVGTSTSQWFSGPYGFSLANNQPLPFVPCKGMLGFFEVDLPDHLAHLLR